MRLNVARRVSLAVGAVLVLFFATSLAGSFMAQRAKEHLQSLDLEQGQEESLVLELLVHIAQYGQGVMRLAAGEAGMRRQIGAAEIKFATTIKQFSRINSSPERQGLSREFGERFKILRRFGDQYIQASAGMRSAYAALAQRTSALNERLAGWPMLTAETPVARAEIVGVQRAYERWFRETATAMISNQHKSSAPTIEVSEGLRAAAARDPETKSAVAAIVENVLQGRRLSDLIEQQRARLLQFHRQREDLTAVLAGDLLPVLRQAKHRRNKTRLDDYDDSFTFLVLMIAFGGIIGAAAGLVMVQGVVMPARSLAAQARLMESENIEARIRLKDLGTDADRDEFSQIAETLNRIAERREQSEKALIELTHHDPLTELPNRVLFLKNLEAAMSNARRIGRLAAVHILDLDDFKNINDSMGHHFGDEVLRLTASRLLECVRDTDVVARLGGDEFAIIQTNLQEEYGVHYLAERIIASLSQPFQIGDNVVHSGTCIGVTIFPEDDEDFTVLMRNAELALHRAKQDGRGSYRLFDPEMNAEIQKRRLMEADLRTALKDGGFYLLYQPRLDITTNKVVGAEALLRWRHEERGEVMPDAFIPIAEHSGLITEITDFVLQETCEQIQKWRARGLDDLVISVNLSPADFRRDDLLSIIRENLERTGIEARHLELEITEGMVMHGVEQVNARLEELRALGVSLAMDDFGTGYSSMSYLKSFSLDVLKIDKSFISGIPEFREDIGITMAILRMAHSLGLAVVAEGVETEEQLDFLRRRKCDQAQGYLISRPLTPDAFFEVITNPQELRMIGQKA